MIGLFTTQDALIFIGIPLAVLAVLAIGVYATTIADGPRYRPGLPWYAEPVWIGGPDLDNAEGDTDSNLAAIDSTDTAAGRLVPSTIGGASARW